MKTSGFLNKSWNVRLALTGTWASVLATIGPYCASRDMSRQKQQQTHKSRRSNEEQLSVWANARNAALSRPSQFPSAGRITKAIIVMILRRIDRRCLCVLPYIHFDEQVAYTKNLPIKGILVGSKKVKGNSRQCARQYTILSRFCIL